MSDFRLIRGGMGGGGDEPPPPEDGDPGPEEGEPHDGKRRKATAIDDRRCTDLANSEIFAQVHGRDLRYCYERKAWLAWSGERWSWDRAQYEIDRRTAQVASDELETALMDRSAPKQVVTWAKKSTSLASRKAMADGMRHRVSVDVNDLDANQMVLNTSSGLVDLRTGKQAPHRREDLATRISPVEYNPKATATRWAMFLQEVTEGDSDLEDYLQRVAGYSITGDMGAQLFFVCVGSGSNGKGVFFRAIQGALGDYARTVSSQLFVETPHNKRPELADLLGVRLAVASEPEGGKRMDEALIKGITGGDEMVAERKFEAPFTFRPVSKLWLACNTIPGFQSGGFSILRRLIVIPFRRTFSGEDADPNLDRWLATEAAGILRWLVKGCLKWQSSGLAKPKAVIDAIAEAQGDMDPLASWWGECVVTGEQMGRVSVTDLHKSYKEWTENAGMKPRGLESFRRLIRGRGLDLVTIERRLYVVGHRLAIDGASEEVHSAGQASFEGV